MFGSKTRTLLKTGKADSHGNLAVSYRAPHSTTFTVVFAGDAKYAPKTVTQVVYVRARASLAISGNYAIKRIGSYTYRLYHRSAHLNVAGGVAPNKHGECVKIEAQEYYQGAWDANVLTACGVLNTSSKVRDT